LDPLTSVERVAFDPVEGRAIGSPTTTVRGSLLLKEPAISPDAEWITLRSWGREDHLYLMKPDGSGLRQITSGSRRDRDPAWAPDGKRIAFHSDRSGRYEAWAIQPDGSGLTQLTHSKDREVLGVHWSPDGAKIAWEDGDHAGIVDLSKANEPGGEEILPKPTEKSVFFPSSWSADGRTLLGHTLGGGGVWSYAIAAR